MKNKILFWILITILSLGAIDFIYVAANNIVTVDGDYFKTLYAVSIFILGISFLLQVFKFIRKPEESKIWLKKLDEPVSSILKTKVPWWIVVYFIAVLFLVIYADYADRL